MWPRGVKEEVLVACGRSCCICHKFCGTNIELHHIKPEARDGPSTLDNCIPLCFDCHADAGHYNDKHPKGTKYTSAELQKHRDTWFEAMKGVKRAERAAADADDLGVPIEVYENQSIRFRGFVWREGLPGEPNYDDFPPDRKEIYWMLVLPKAFRLNYSSLEDDRTITVPEVRKLQLVLNSEQYGLNKDLVMQEALITGRVHPSITGHHHGDALLEVSVMEAV